jgi:hypothetical protein
VNHSSLLLAGIAALLSTPAAGQLTSVPHSGEQSIVITGPRPKGQPTAPVQMSDWRVAETPHVLVFSKGNVQELARIASNLEKLHFLLSVLLNRVNDPDDTLKIQVTLIGDPTDFDHLGLRNVRWQQGPYPDEFPTEIYYDPREDGAVMAGAHADQCFKLVRDAAVMSGEEFWEQGAVGQVSPGESGNQVTSDLASAVSAGTGSTSRTADSCADNPNNVMVTAESRLYSAFAQHYLLTYFPAAYPRWYLEGFGEIFANMDADKPGIIEYGREPDRYPALLDKFGHYPVRKVLDGTYLHDKQWTPTFSPYSAWALVHLLFFSPQWRKVPLHNYLAAVARGASPEQAAAALGDIKKLQRAVSAYRGTRVDFERLTYPAGQFSPPIERRLKESEAIYVRGRLELGARVTIADVEDARQKGLNAREHWLNGLRSTTAEYPNELADQQLLAEAECRSGNADRCVAAANQALSISGSDPVAMTWKGYGLALKSVSAPAWERAAWLNEARSTIIEANHLDTESVLPLLAYYRSYSVAGETPPVEAIDGLDKSLDEVPSAPTTRLMLGSALIGQSDAYDARRILLPVADGAFDPPEKPLAQQLLSGIRVRAGGGSSAAR